MAVLRRVKVAFSTNHPLHRKQVTAGQSKRHSIVGLTKDGADRVTFSYDDKDNQVVRDISIQVCNIAPFSSIGTNITTVFNPELLC